MSEPSIIPAAPGTLILARRDERTVSIPAIAWRVFPFGGDRPSPVGPNFEYAGAKDDTAVLHPSGHVTLKVPVDGYLVFDSLAEWEEFIDGREQTGTETEAEEETDDGPNPGTGFVMQDDTGEAKPGPSRPISFGTKTYKSKSFWRLDNFLFIIEPETPYPNDDRAVKIKREDYFALRKDDRYEVIDPHTGELEDTSESAPAAEPDDDDMDAADLV